MDACRWYCRPRAHLGLRRDLEQLSSDAGAELLRALGVKGDQAELRTASDEFSGHCLALTLLGSYLTDAFDGDIRRRDEVSTRLAHDVRQGVHARRLQVRDGLRYMWYAPGIRIGLLRNLTFRLLNWATPALLPVIGLKPLPHRCEGYLLRLVESRIRRQISPYSRHARQLIKLLNLGTT